LGKINAGGGLEAFKKKIRHCGLVVTRPVFSARGKKNSWRKERFNREKNLGGNAAQTHWGVTEQGEDGFQVEKRKKAMSVGFKREFPHHRRKTERNHPCKRSDYGKREGMRQSMRRGEDDCPIKGFSSREEREGAV